LFYLSWIRIRKENEDPDPVRWKLKNLMNKLGFLPLKKNFAFNHGLLVEKQKTQ